MMKTPTPLPRAHTSRSISLRPLTRPDAGIDCRRTPPASRLLLAQGLLLALAWLACQPAAQAQEVVSPEQASGSEVSSRPYASRPHATPHAEVSRTTTQADADRRAGDATASATELPGITVTAKGYEADSATTPVATTVLDRGELARRQPANVGEALRHEPGLAVESDSAQGQNPVIRGLKRDSIVLLVDGMRFNSAQPAGAVASFMSLGLAERVEVVKGPASVLYGTGALGGAINVRLPQARFQPGLGVRASATLDSGARGRQGAAVLNASQGDHALMLGAMMARHGDYRSPDGKVARTGYRSQALIGQYRLRLDAHQQLRLSLQQHEDKDVWYPGGTRAHPNPRIGSLTTHSPEQHRRLAELGYSHAPTPGLPLDLDLRLYRQEMKRSIYGHANGLGRDISATDVTFSTDGLDARAGWQLDERHLLSVGTNLWRMRASPDSRQAMPPAFTPMVASAPFHDGELRALGVYLQDDFRHGPWQVLVGLRHDRVRGSASAMNNGRVTQGLDRSDGATSASLGVLHEISPALRPYLNLARAFRAPDLRERYQSGLRSDGFFYAGSPQIAPETATQLELGLKGSTPSLDYALAFYHNRIGNYITGTELSGAAAVAACGQTNAAACKRNLNLGHVTLSGLEAGIDWQFARQHWLHLSYSLLRGTNKDLDEPLYQMPADRLNLGWRHRLDAAWSVDADLHLARRQDRVASRFTRGREDATPGHGVIDVGGNWQFAPRQTLRLAVRNLADKRYHDHLAEGSSGSELPAPGRSVVLSWQGSF